MKIHSLLSLIFGMCAVLLPFKSGAQVVNSGSAWQTPLVTRTGQEVGQVLIWNDETNLYVDYEVDPGWRLWETHMAVEKALNLIPQTSQGSPIVEKFPYETTYHGFRGIHRGGKHDRFWKGSKYRDIKKDKSFDADSTTESYVIPLADRKLKEGDLLYFAIHAEVRQLPSGLVHHGKSKKESKDNKSSKHWDRKSVCDVLKSVNPMDVWASGKLFRGKTFAMYVERTIQPTVILPSGPTTAIVLNPDGYSFVDVELSNLMPGTVDLKDGKYMGWFVNIDGFVEFGVKYQDNLKFYSSYDASLPANLQRSDWDKVNYILNHKRGTKEDVQNAIWYFVGGSDYPEDEDPAIMVDEAEANGNGYVPGLNDTLGILVDLGDGYQKLIIELKPGN